MLLYRDIYCYALCFLRYHYFYLGQFIKNNYMEVPVLSPRLQLAELDESIVLTRTYFAVHETFFFFFFGGGEKKWIFSLLFFSPQIFFFKLISVARHPQLPLILKQETRCKSHWFTSGNTLERSKSARVQAVSCGRSVAVQSIHECIVKSMLCIIRALQG